MSLSLDGDLAEGAAHFGWLQSLRLSPGFVTPGIVGEAHLLAEEQALFGSLNLTGAHVLEVGAANGHFSLAAKRRGAARVLATDHTAWTLPGSTAEEATRFAARAQGLDIETLALDPRALTPEHGSFDVVLGTNFFEQLFNPLAALKAMRAVTRRMVLIQTLMDLHGDARPAMSANLIEMPYGATVAGWAPNPPCVMHLLLELGFQRIFFREHPSEGALRGIFAGFLSSASPAALTHFNARAGWTQLTGLDR
ncbi:class I SAM-dependent methyltransferase [Roseococcus sp. YIM B11640]|uniref:class I SAM-dependent methyltransferase n=1 Tax=Roseococcus sp. YIM B11640 TaxID=3133973 RepID=UPI003C7CBCFC